MLKRLPFSLLVLGMLLSAGPVAAVSISEAIEYDIFKRGDSISIWLNLAQFLSSKRVDQMKEGIDLAFEYRLILSRPRHLWGAEQIAKTRGLIKVAYQIVTESYSISTEQLGRENSRHFVSLARLHQFLSDSVVVKLADCQELDPQRRYTLEIKVTCISLTDFNLAADSEPSEKSGSPIKYLFRQFLRLTDFGREEYIEESGPFSLSEIDSED